MPVWKYRRVEDMPDVGVLNRDKPVESRIRALRGFSGLAPALGIPRGVMRFRSFEELAADRQRHESARIARIRTRVEQKS